MACLALMAVLVLAFGGGPALAQDADSDDQDAQTKALDSTATQWSFQFAYQVMPDYYADTLDDGSTRPAGMTDYVQLRIVAPVALKTMTILPRLTFRHYENPQGESGIGNTELFGLIIPKSWDWGSGRGGIGPLVTFPGDEKVSKDEFGYGFAAAAVNGKGKWFYGLLATQSWRSVDPNNLPPEKTNTNPLGLAPFLNYRLPKGWYIGNGDMIIQYDWDSGKVHMPIGVRVGNVIVLPNNSWNIYAEYQTSLIHDGWEGAAVKNSYRLNVTYTMPLGK